MLGRGLQFIHPQIFFLGLTMSVCTVASFTTWYSVVYKESLNKQLNERIHEN